MWYRSCTASDRKYLAGVVKTTQSPIPHLNIKQPGSNKAGLMAADPNHPGRKVGVPPASGRRYRNIRSHTNRLKHSFLPKTVASSPVSSHTPTHRLSFKLHWSHHPHGHSHRHCTFVFLLPSFYFLVFYL